MSEFDFNRKNLNRLIAHLELAPGKSFDMNSWIDRGENHPDTVTTAKDAKNIVKRQENAEKHNCGTVACIAGHAALLRSIDEKHDIDHYNVSEVAQEWLGIDDYQALQMFNPGAVWDAESIIGWGNWSYDDVKRKHALRMLKHFRKTGKIDWSKARISA